MRRRLSALLLGLVASLAIAAPALADTVPDPGNYRDSGSADYFHATVSDCLGASCTDTTVYGAIADLHGGDVVVHVCVDRYTYSIRGGGGGTWAYGCAEVAPDIAADLTSASFSGTIQVESCGRRTCTIDDVNVSVSMAVVGEPIPYAHSQKFQYDNCTDTYRVRGSSAPAEGSMEVDGTSFAAYGAIGSETFAYSVRCR